MFLSRKKIKSPNFSPGLVLLNKIEFLFCFQPIHHLSSYLYSFKSLSLFSLRRSNLRFQFSGEEAFRFHSAMAKNVGILAMDIYFPPTCVQQVKIPSFLIFFFDFIYFFLRLIRAIAFILCFCRSFQRFLYCKNNTLILTKKKKITHWFQKYHFEFALWRLIS